jgi:hypothetical protein
MDTEKSEYLGKTVPANTVYDKSHMNCPGIESGPPR